ncbi:transglutaminaseTgpA domain-containing protein [Alteromonas sp. R78001]|uniref:transglutaminase family protein n=1 Tax=Alteromonas sp. R78001 TaxID=3093865 RepID=UPI00366C707B
MNNKANMLLATCFMVLTLSLLTPLLTWVVLLAICAVIMQSALYFRWQEYNPSSRTVNLLAVLSLIALGWFGFSIGLLNSMINLLVIACSLKLMLLSRTKDFLQLFCSCIFLVGCGFIFALGIEAWVGYVAVIVLLFTALSLVYAPARSFRVSMRKSAIILLQAFPLAALLFVVMPQLPPLWQMPTSKSNETGLSDSVTPGDIASLARSSDLAFTATFEQSPPLAEQRYWRAMTMEAFDGKTWTISPRRKQAEAQLKTMGRSLAAPSPNGSLTPSENYQLIVEPSNQRWLYSLDVSAENTDLDNPEMWRQFNYALRAARPIVGKRAFYLSYFPDTPLVSEIYDFDYQLNIQYPIDSNLRTQAWVKQLTANAKSEQSIAEDILRHFKTGGFSYTLQPNAMPNSPIDTFMFEAKAGFCAHYASAMVFALRVAGIPARMVTGYQGGELLSDNVIQVRQYDAHAWVEALIDGVWVSYDPTSMVAPSRITFGLEQALADFNETRSEGMFKDLGSAELFLSIRGWFRQLDYQWSRLVLGFDNQTQTDLLKKLLGDLTSQKMTLFFLSVLGIVSIFLLVLFFPVRRRSTLPKHQRIYLNAVELVSNFTEIARKNKGSTAYFKQVKPFLPVHAASLFGTLTQDFEHAQYQGATDGGRDGQKQKERTMADTLAALQKDLKRTKAN